MKKKINQSRLPRRSKEDWQNIQSVVGEFCGAEATDLCCARHYQYTVRRNGQQRKLVFAKSPSDSRGFLNHLSLLRRTLDGMGSASNAR